MLLLNTELCHTEFYNGNHAQFSTPLLLSKKATQAAIKCSINIKRGPAAMFQIDRFN